MKQEQHSLFGAAPAEEPKRKAKAMPKIAKSAPASKDIAPPLPPTAAKARDNALASVCSRRAAAKIGDIRISDWPCPQCGEERIEELAAIAKEGGFSWDQICLKCHQPGC